MVGRMGLARAAHQVVREGGCPTVVGEEGPEAFAQVNAVFNAWPYWRELVQASLARMSMPALTVPVFRVAPVDTAEEAEQDDDE